MAINPREQSGKADGPMTTEKRATRAGSRALRVTILAVAALAILAGIVFWSAQRPHYRTYQTSATGDQQAPMIVSYPSDWTIDDWSGDRGQSSTIVLTHTPPRGLQAWIDQYLGGISRKDWQFSTIQMQSIRLMGTPDIDNDARRMDMAMRQLARQGVTYSIKRSICAGGPFLDIQSHNPKGDVIWPSNTLLLYPAALPGEPSVEVIVHYSSPNHLHNRVHQTALDVVSRLRLVKAR